MVLCLVEEPQFQGAKKTSIFPNTNRTNLLLCSLKYFLCIDSPSQPGEDSWLIPKELVGSHEAIFGLVGMQTTHKNPDNCKINQQNNYQCINSDMDRRSNVESGGKRHDLKFHDDFPDLHLLFMQKLIFR